MVTSCAPATPLGETPKGRGSGSETGAGVVGDIGGGTVGTKVRGPDGVGLKPRTPAISGGGVNTHVFAASPISSRRILMRDGASATTTGSSLMRPSRRTRIVTF